MFSYMISYFFKKKKWWQSIKNWYSYDILQLWNSHKKFSFGDEFCMDISHNTTIIRSHSLMTTLCVTSQRVLGSILVVGIFFETSFFFAFLRKLLQTYSFWLIMVKLRLLQRLQRRCRSRSISSHVQENPVSWSKYNIQIFNIYFLNDIIFLAQFFFTYTFIH